MVAFRFVAIGSFLANKYKIPYLTLKIQGHGHGQGLIWWAHSGLICLLFLSWQSDNFWLSYIKFHIWPWKFKVKVSTEIDQNLLIPGITHTHTHLHIFEFLLYVHWKSSSWRHKYCSGATGISHCIRCYGPRSLTAPHSPSMLPILQCTLHHT